MKYRMIKIFFMIAACFLATNALAHSSGGIVVKDAWVREAPPNVKMMAAYMTIENHTDAEAVLTSVQSSNFKKVEIHETVEKDGMASMVQRKQLNIPAEGNVKLAPRGKHLMLIDPTGALKAGDNVSFTLKFANGSTSVINAKVKKAMSEHQHEHEHSDMHHDH